jgi:hypothetical protein
MENKMLKRISIISFFQIDNFKNEYSKEFKKDIVVNYPIALNETNWYEYKEKFKKERFNSYYKNNLTDKEIIGKEIKKLDNMLNNLGLIYFIKHRDTFETLAKRYKDYLSLPLPPIKTSQKYKIPAKYYALYHWILIELGIENHFERNENDKYSKTKIVAFAKERYKKTSSQMFYRTIIDIDINNKTAIANSFGNKYKDKIISISNNNAKVITHLKSFPN